MENAQYRAILAMVVHIDMTFPDSLSRVSVYPHEIQYRYVYQDSNSNRFHHIIRKYIRNARFVRAGISMSFTTQYYPDRDLRSGTVRLINLEHCVVGYLTDLLEDYRDPLYEEHFFVSSTQRYIDKVLNKWS